MNDNDAQGLDKIFPMNKGDNFRLGPYHFVCMGWKDGRILATRYDAQVHMLFGHSLSPELVLSPGFKMLTRAEPRVEGT